MLLNEQDAGGQKSPLPVSLTEKVLLQGGLSWHPEALLPPQHTPARASIGWYTEFVTPSTSPYGEPYDLLRLDDVDTTSPWLADTVDESYQAMRQSLRAELGYDFLGELSEMFRPINFKSEDSLYASWHKAGRAFDTLFELPANRMQLVREEIGGETYWRIFLRCLDQTGQCGQPLQLVPWDYSYRARWILAPDEGGRERAPITGYYVDFTQRAEMYGWERISSYDDDDFSWRSNFTAFEYWHYQKPGRANGQERLWYQAMQEVHPPARVHQFFNWDTMQAKEQPPYLSLIQGIPSPPEAERWWQALVP